MKMNDCVIYYWTLSIDHILSLAYVASFYRHYDLFAVGSDPNNFDIAGVTPGLI